MESEVMGYAASVLIGISLGLIGGGGSILTVPVLVYLFALEPITATAYSLFVVGATSAVGVLSYLRRGLVSIKTALIFGIPSMLAVFSTRAFVVPALPPTLYQGEGWSLTKDMAVMLLFAILMLAASVSMIRTGKQPTEESAQQHFNYPLILLEGLVVGVLTGLVGAGGGFLIIPALVVLSKLPMKLAVGTSLLIIAAKSLFGFLGESAATPISWHLLLAVTAFAIAGIALGSLLSKRINGQSLKPIFGWFTLGMGIYVLLNQLLKL